MIKTSQKRDTPSVCPFCSSFFIVKRGLRKNKYETIQLYLCNTCHRVFTSQKVKHKHYPLKLILEGLTLYNLGHSLTETCKMIKEKFGIPVKSSTLSNWLKEFRGICAYARLRPQAKKLYTPNQLIRSQNLNHRQVYNFCYHQAKIDIVLKQYPSNKSFAVFKNFLESIYANCPHHLFQQSLRASQFQKAKFDLKQVMVREKYNFANRVANLILQVVKTNRARHEALQRFMLINDSVTVACEVPVYLTKRDLEHMESKLNFEFPSKLDLLTGHIDLIQFRNGLIHILDYKPNATREKPYEQLTWYAVALSRLTGLRIYDFKCAWFDEENYFEFFPLHMVYKLKTNV